MYSCTPKCKYAIGLIKNVPTYFCPFVPTYFCLSSSLSHSSYVFFFSSSHCSSLFFTFFFCPFFAFVLFTFLFFIFFLYVLLLAFPFAFFKFFFFALNSSFSDIILASVACRPTNETVFQILTKTISILTGIDLSQILGESKYWGQ